MEYEITRIRQINTGIGNLDLDLDVSNNKNYRMKNIKNKINPYKRSLRSTITSIIFHLLKKLFRKIKYVEACFNNSTFSKNSLHLSLTLTKEVYNNLFISRAYFTTNQVFCCSFSQTFYFILGIKVKTKMCFQKYQ